MNRIERLFKELCPHGVEWKRITDVYSRLQGTPITARKMKEIEEPDGKIKVFAGGRTVINTTESKLPNANIIRVPAVLVQSRGIIDAVYYDQPFTFKNEMWAYTADNLVTVKYLYYALKNNISYFRQAASGMGSLPQISLKDTENFSIPFPPLPIQREIVQYLDNFTKLTAELTAELTTRQIQYEHYRNRLLTFGDEVKRQEIGKILVRTKGTSITAGKMREIHKEGAPVKIFAGGSTVADVNFDDIPVKDINRKPSVIVKSRGNIGFEYYDKPFSHKSEFWSYYSNKNEVNIKFVYYFLSNNIAYFQNIANNMQMPQISIPVTDRYKIPLPPLLEQQRIVSILDKFDALVNDISIGLPAEIEARQKQYEYYREKLLTFKKLDKKEA